MFDELIAELEEELVEMQGIIDAYGDAVEEHQTAGGVHVKRMPYEVALNRKREIKAELRRLGAEPGGGCCQFVR